MGGTKAPTGPTQRPGPHLNLGDSEPIHVEKAETASPAADSYHLSFWVESNAVQGLGTGVLGGQLPSDYVPQLQASTQAHGGQQPAVWTQAAASDLVLVSLDLEHPTTVLQVPELQEPIKGS